jgi:hypothetical protein
MLNFSVIVAAQDAGPHLRECLAALSAQFDPREMEVVVADGSGRPDVDKLAEQFPAFHLLPFAPPISVPRLWWEAIAASKGRIVALTIENCVPAPDWARRMLAAHAKDGPAAIGGAIAMDPRGSLADWAVYFCRYSSYMPGFSPRFAEDLAGDNCSYMREALMAEMPDLAEGFWETFVHRGMRRRGEHLQLDPAAMVTYRGGLPPWRFLRRRYRHGRYFAARRGRDFGAGARLVRAASFPAVAAVLLGRIAARVWRRRRFRTRFALALPLVTAFLLAWAAGEAAGYLRGASAAFPPESD